MSKGKGEAPEDGRKGKTVTREALQFKYNHVKTDTMLAGTERRKGVILFF